jgi:hypothetical protein
MSKVKPPGSAFLASFLVLTAFALTVLGASAESIRPVYPTLAESAEYWSHARIVIDTPVGTRVHLVFGHAALYGGPGIFCIRTSREQKVIQELFYTAGESGAPVLEEREKGIVLKMPSGFVLIEIPKEPIQPPAPTRGNGT